MVEKFAGERDKRRVLERRNLSLVNLPFLIVTPVLIVTPAKAGVYPGWIPAGVYPVPDTGRE
jgi:hypothetical protein